MTKLFVLLITVLALIAISVSAQDFDKIFSADYRENAKMIMCGMCKDEGVMADIMKFGQCVQGLYPKEFANMMTIRQANMDDPDECIGKMKSELEGYARTDPSGIVKVLDCFKSNVVPAHLSKCH